jgi:hypothetical protein
LLAHGRWFSPGTPVSATTKTERHDLAEILLKVALKHQKSKIKLNRTWNYVFHFLVLIMQMLLRLILLVELK